MLQPYRDLIPDLLLVIWFAKNDRPVVRVNILTRYFSSPHNKRTNTKLNCRGTTSENVYIYIGYPYLCTFMGDK